MPILERTPEEWKLRWTKCKKSKKKLRDYLLSSSLNEWKDWCKEMGWDAGEDPAHNRPVLVEKLMDHVISGDWDNGSKYTDKSAKRGNMEHQAIPTKDIKTTEPFKSLHLIKPETIQAITKDMKTHGFDHAFPIILGSGPWTKKDVLLDGHTRLEAAKKAKIKELRYVCHEFKDEDAAFNYILEHQRDRRNYTDADIIHLVDTLWKRQERDKTGKFKGESGQKQAEIIAGMLKVGISKVERARMIIQNKDTKLWGSVLNDELSIHKAYEAIKETRKPSTPRTPGTTPSKRADRSVPVRSGNEEPPENPTVESQEPEVFAPPSNVITNDTLTGIKAVMGIFEEHFTAEIRNDCINAKCKDKKCPCMLTLSETLDALDEFVDNVSQLIKKTEKDNKA